MMSLSTAHVVINFIRSYDILQMSRKKQSEGDYSELCESLFLAKTTIFWIQSALADGVLIWRCFVIISQKRLLVMMLPVLLMMGGLVIGCYCLVKWLPSAPGSDQTTRLAPLISAYFVMTMIINVYCTGAIVAWVAYKARGCERGTQRIMSALATLVRSGALYTAGIIAFLGAQLAKNNGQYPTVDLLPSLAGVVYCMIIIQMYHQPWTEQSYTTQEPSSGFIETFEIDIGLEQSIVGRNLHDAVGKPVNGPHPC
ncbi:hypothetical protein EVG20_g2104 [Dentipellis fragilis]|uniref:Uncharacterized protein n=1 Tax=Dentipellis fragilis TaxID=205917 RepID=A0A4Y9Z818_9AGAM|nr:hypothetical protein EVG20_g2104 [Dentipellis fragilis]